MKKRALMGVLMMTLLVSLAAAAHAQASGRVVADIPFNFQIGGETLPAGEYVVQPATADGAALLISVRDGGQSVIALTISARGKQSAHARMVFNRYGERYFLRAVWESGVEGKLLTESGRERRLRRELRAMARTGGARSAVPEIVAVAAHREAR